MGEKMTSISKFIMLMIFGAFLGAIMLLLIGGLHRLLLIDFMAASSNPVEYILMFIYALIPSILLGMFSAAIFWRDWVLFSAVLGALTVYFFLKMEEGYGIVIQTSSPKKFGIGILIVILACGIFFLHRQATANAILGRYVDFCSAMQKHNDEAAYAYMSPEYQQKVSLNAFKKVVQKKANYPSVSEICSHPVSSEWEVSFWENTGLFSDPGNFMDFLAYHVACYFKNVNDEWYLDDVPSEGGLD